MNNPKIDLWNANLYDQSHSFVSAYGQVLVELLKPTSGEQILDIGCGTGDLVNVIAEAGAHVTGIDASENMVQQAKAKYPGIHFEQMDATKLTFVSEFDAVFSNATLHWIKTPVPVVEGVYQSLKDGGRFVAEFGGKGNVQSITDVLIAQMKLAGIPFTNDDFPWYFPSIGEYTTLLEAEGFRVELAHHYDRPTKLDGELGLYNWLAMFSPGLFAQVEDEVKERIFKATIEKLRPTLFKDGDWYADYKRLRVVAYKI